MTTQISSKLVALTVALIMNSAILGGVAYLFNADARQHVVLSLAEVPAVATSEVA
jgi:hypothetical protein